MNAIKINRELIIKSLIALGVGLSALLFAVNAVALEPATTDTNTTTAATPEKKAEPTKTPLRPAVKEIRTEAKKDIKAERTEAKEVIKEKRAEVKEMVKNVREDKTLKTPETRETIKEKRAEAKDVRQETKEKVAERKEVVKKEAKELIEERRVKEAAEKLRKHVAKLVARLNAAIERVETLSDRVASRIRKIEAVGGVATEAKGYLEQANKLTAEAKVDVATLEAMVRTELAGSTTPKEIGRKIDASLDPIKRKIQAAHENVVKAIASLKGMSTASKKAATTTPTTNQ